MYDRALSLNFKFSPILVRILSAPSLLFSDDRAGVISRTQS